MAEKKEETINRWMKMKSKWAFYPHFILTRDTDGLYHSACGRINTKDMLELTEEEALTVAQDRLARCGNCDYSPRSKPSRIL